jgi:SAM-dependent methyltransferase
MAGIIGFVGRGGGPSGGPLASIGENRERWTTYDWPGGGDEWSQVWGGTRNLWWATLYPRLQDYLPAATVLEIAPGYGRFTQYLKDFCQRLVLVDLTERCIEACRQRFREARNVDSFVNDGRTLPMVADRSVDFAFSFDSLVHVEADALRSYLLELGRKLTPDGVGFFHHSNLGALIDPASGELPFVNRHWRAASMSADRFVEYCAEASLACVVQEVVNWGCPQLTDCLSVFTPRGSRHARPLARWENGDFMAEAERLAAISCRYRPPAAAAAGAR